MSTERFYDIKNTVTQFEDYDKALKFKMAVNDEDELNTLLTYYRDRINEFDNERTEWLERLEQVRLNQEDKHKLEWELQKRRDEIVELQKYLTESKVSLFDERQMVLRLTKENDQLKLKEREDRKKIQELMSLNEPVEEEVVLQRDLRPNINHKFVKTNTNFTNNKENKSTNKYGATNYPNNLSKNIVKTIYMPNENLNTISIENQNLRSQLEQFTSTTQQQINALKNELQIRDDEMRLRYNDDQSKLTDLSKRYFKLENLHLEQTKQYFQLKLQCNDREKRLHEESELIRLRNTALANKLMLLQKQTSVETRAIQELAERKSDEYTSKFRNQVIKKEDDISVMKNQYAQAQKIYIQKVKELELSLSKLSEKYYQLEKRRSLEVEGYKASVNILQKKLDQMEVENLSNTNSQKIVPKENFDDEYQKQQKIQKKKKQQIYGGDKDKKQPKKKKKTVQQSDKKSESDKSETVQMEELEEIKNQLDDLETQLDVAKNN